MFGFGKSDEELYNEGVEDGKNSDFFDEIAAPWGDIMPGTSDDEIRHEGFKEGIRQKYND